MGDERRADGEGGRGMGDERKGKSGGGSHRDKVKLQPNRFSVFERVAAAPLDSIVVALFYIFFLKIIYILPPPPHPRSLSLSFFFFFFYIHLHIQRLRIRRARA